MNAKQKLAEELIDQIRHHDFSDCQSEDEKIVQIKEIAKEFKQQHHDEFESLSSEKLSDEELDQASGGSVLNDVIGFGKDLITSVSDIDKTVVDVWDEIF